jgi:Fe-S cluster assembly iron-binding protein IscA
MLTMTENAVDAIKQLAPVDGGLRLFVGARPGEPGGKAIRAALTPAPAPEDAVVASEGARVFLDPQVTRLLRDRVLDARMGRSGVKFGVVRQS